MARVLVVEDDPSMKNILVDTLEDEGHDVKSAGDGKLATSLTRNNTFDLVISDVRLPGMDGVEVLTELRNIQPGVKCIVITGYASEDTPARAIRLGVDDYLFKPFSLTYFLKIVDRVLQSEQEREQKSSLLRKLFSFLEKSDKEALRELVAEREEAYRGLYLGARSGYLSKAASHEVYSKLEDLETWFRAILNKDKNDLPEIHAVRDKYTELGNRIAELELSNISADVSDGVPKEQFDALFEAVKSSHIGLDDLQYAPLLRNTPDERFEAHAKLLDLKHHIWPNPHLQT